MSAESPRGPGSPIAHYVGRRLHRRIFAWFSATIVMTAALVGVGVRILGVVDADGPDRRVDVVVEDEGGRSVGGGGACRHPVARIPFTRDGRGAGNVVVCIERPRPRPLLRVGLPLLVLLGVLWLAAGLLARRLARPLSELAEVAEDIGRGRFESRRRLRHDQEDEVGLLSDVVGAMAERIEGQLEGQRALLAAVSHEIRSPLARMRLLVEMGRDPVDPTVFDKLDAEIIDLDVLVGDLLAGARVDFAALRPVALGARDLAHRALEVTGAAPSVLADVPAGVLVKGDATLLGRALQNLVANAQRHGGGIVALRVIQGPGASGRGPLALGEVAFEVDDAGAGFGEGEEERVFEPFYKRPRPGAASASVGLGLTLVRRIAEAHGGRAYARNRRDEGGVVVGATVGFTVGVSA